MEIIRLDSPKANANSISTERLAAQLISRSGLESQLTTASRLLSLIIINGVALAENMDSSFLSLLSWGGSVPDIKGR
jgi:hypothetical protein